MIPFWEIHRASRKFFENYYPQILTLSAIVATSIGYFHFELNNNSKELSRWKNFLQVFNQMEALIMLPILLLVTSLMLVFVVVINLDSMRCYDELTHLQTRKRYSDFLFIQLITRIEGIEKRNLNKEVVSIENFVRAHDELHSAIDKFRMDTKTILALSDVDVMLPPEMVFADDEIRSSRFAHLSLEENLVRELAAS